MKKTLVIMGGGDHGAVVADIANEIGFWESIVFLDDRFGELKEILGYPVIGDFCQFESKALQQYDFFCCIRQLKTPDAVVVST